MYNIWSFFLQTISVSIVAGVILFLKYIFQDKLSPRWQYGIWTLLAVRILLPVSLTKYIIPQIAVWIEIGKGIVEKGLDSVYTQVYEPIVLKHIIPIVTEKPQSMTDILFVIYIIGIVVCVFYYMIAYFRLRILLRAACPVSDALEKKVLELCEKYNLKPCKLIAVEGFSSAFLCGVFRPVLVVPYAKELDEKILLHELLHLKYHDTIQNIGWCVLRSLHWCNPLMHYVINQIENDMESLCDQRVLELLDGEARREYGVILLDMASKQYARIPGTSSISNGSKNIAKRIASIVRFKKYPQGMALVSICIIFILFWPTVIGSAHTFTQDDYKQYELESSMAIARINRCTTVAGALDTYAKGLYLYNGIYIASASSLSEHERIEAELNEYGCYQSGEFFGNITELKDYYVFNIDQRTENEYTAAICYEVSVQADEHLMEILDELNIEEGICNCDAYLFIPVSVRYEDAWVVEEIGERYIISEKDYINSTSFMLCGKQYYGENDNGEVHLAVETKYTVDNTIQNNNMFWSSASFDTSPKPNAVFNYYRINKHVIYASEEKPRSYVELTIKELDSEDYFKPQDDAVSIEDHGKDGWRIFKGTTEWDGRIEDYVGGGYGSSEEEIVDLPSKYSVDIVIAGEKMEGIQLKEVSE